MMDEFTASALLKTDMNSCEEGKNQSVNPF